MHELNRTWFHPSFERWSSPYRCCTMSQICLHLLCWCKAAACRQWTTEPYWKSGGWIVCIVWRTAVINHFLCVTGSCWDAWREGTLWTRRYCSKWETWNICEHPFSLTCLTSLLNCKSNWFVFVSQGKRGMPGNIGKPGPLVSLHLKCQFVVHWGDQHRNHTQIIRSYKLRLRFINCNSCKDD